MLRSRSIRSFAFTVSFAAISVSATTPVNTDALGHFTCISGGHFTFCAAFTMGRMDCSGVYNTYNCSWCCDLCDAQDTGQQESEEEEDSSECGDEW